MIRCKCDRFGRDAGHLFVERLESNRFDQSIGFCVYYRDCVRIAVRDIKPLVHFIPSHAGWMKSDGNCSRDVTRNQIDPCHCPTRDQSMLIDEYLIGILLWTSCGSPLLWIWKTAAPIADVSGSTVSIHH